MKNQYEEEWHEKNKSKINEINKKMEKLFKKKRVQREILIFRTKKQRVKFKYNFKTYNFKIINSFLITNKQEMIKELERHRGDLRKVNRSVKSALREWRAHNWLFEHGLFIEHTKDCDIELSENRFKRFCYFFLSKLYRG